MNRKITLITGASRGIGLCAAKKFIDEGFHVVAVARSIEDLEKLDNYAKTQNDAITIVPLDICNLEKVNELGYKIYEKFGVVDVFIANASILGGCMPITHYTYETWHKVITTNLTSHWVLLRSIHQLLRLSKAGRVIATYDCESEQSRAFYGLYDITKAGLKSLIKTYAYENLNSNIKANLLYPGIKNTKLRSEAFPNIKISDIEPNVADLFLKLSDETLQKSGEVFYCDHLEKVR